MFLTLILDSALIPVRRSITLVVSVVDLDSVFHHGHVDHAEDPDDAETSGVDADRHEREDVERARQRDQARALVHQVPDQLEPGDDGDAAEQGAAEPGQVEGVLEGHVMDRR